MSLNIRRLKNGDEIFIKAKGEIGKLLDMFLVDTSGLEFICKYNDYEGNGDKFAIFIYNLIIKNNILRHKKMTEMFIIKKNKINMINLFSDTIEKQWIFRNTNLSLSELHKIKKSLECIYNAVTYIDEYDICGDLDNMRFKLHNSFARGDSTPFKIVSQIYDVTFVYNN